jgi:hypothetical protein
MLLEAVLDLSPFYAQNFIIIIIIIIYKNKVK